MGADRLNSSWFPPCLSVSMFHTPHASRHPCKRRQLVRPGSGPGRGRPAHRSPCLISTNCASEAGANRLADHGRRIRPFAGRRGAGADHAPRLAGTGGVSHGFAGPAGSGGHAGHQPAQGSGSSRRQVSRLRRCLPRPAWQRPTPSFAKRPTRPWQPSPCSGATWF